MPYEERVVGAGYVDAHNAVRAAKFFSAVPHPANLFPSDDPNAPQITDAADDQLGTTAQDIREAYFTYNPISNQVIYRLVLTDASVRTPNMRWTLTSAFGATEVFVSASVDETATSYEYGKITTLATGTQNQESLGLVDSGEINGNVITIKLSLNKINAAVGYGCTRLNLNKHAGRSSNTNRLVAFRRPAVEFRSGHRLQLRHRGRSRSNSDTDTNSDTNSESDRNPDAYPDADGDSHTVPVSESYDHTVTNAVSDSDPRRQRRPPTPGGGNGNGNADRDFKERYSGTINPGQASVLVPFQMRRSDLDAKIKQNHGNEQVFFQILDASGNVIATADDDEIELENLQAGTYYFRITGSVSRAVDFTIKSEQSN